MDRYEYKTKLDEIILLIKEGKKEEAAEEMEAMNWRKVRNVNALMKAADLYEEMDLLEEAKNLLMDAHERSPIGRMIIYRLAILCIQMDAFEEAGEYYDEFVEIAPHDSMKYIIKYQLNKAKQADDDTLISILEELKDHDFLEEWAFELACLYHKTAQIDKCIDLCDEIILWFGDGAYVEKALELKMLYQPLDKAQEDKYRHFQQKKDGITEIRPEDTMDSGVVLQKPITIPSIELPPERFNTVNLQAEIKKNIDEIMRATEAGEVSENMDNIKMLVEEIPYLQVNEEPVEVAREHLETEENINTNLKNTFQEYLAEEYDGQISLFVPEKTQAETQVKGQMTIEEVMEEWDKTRRAAEAALQDASQQKLEIAKEKALKEANTIMNRLEGVIPKLDAGVAPAELLKEEYLQKQTSQEPQEAMRSLEDYAAGLVSEEPEKETSLEHHLPTVEETGKHFQIPKVPVGVGLEIPVVHVEGARLGKEGIGIPVPALTKSKDGNNTRDWEPPTLGSTSEEKRKLEDDGTVDVKEASKIVADVNAMLQQEINRLIEDEAAVAPEETVETAEESDALQETLVMEEEIEAAPEETEKQSEEPETQLEEQDSLEEAQDISEEPEETSEDIEQATEDGLENKEVELDMEEKSESDEIKVSEPTVRMPSIEDIIAATQKQEAQEEEPEEDPVAILADAIAEEIQQEEGSILEEDVQEEEQDNIEETAQEIVLPEIEEIKLEPEEVADLVDEKVLEKAISDELPVMKLTEEEKEIFSYFMPISGMESTVCAALTGARTRLTNSTNASSGNIIIQGTAGSGKTMMATNLIQVLQKEIDKPNGNIGKIDGDKLNDKDIQKLFSKIQGGCLIIEKAGEITRETAVTLSLLMEQDTSGLLVIVEDNHVGIQRLMGLDASFARKFTEKISIPIFTIDELVNFGKTYAKDAGYVIDEMGVLAMYNRINLIQRLDHPTSLVEVTEIMENAMDHAERGGLKGFFSKLGTSRFDDEGNTILREKDFEE